MSIAEWMQALGPLAVEKRKPDNSDNFCLDVILVITAHISLARINYVAKPNFKGTGVFSSTVCPEEEEYSCTAFMTTILVISSFTLGLLQSSPSKIIVPNWDSENQGLIFPGEWST